MAGPAQATRWMVTVPQEDFVRLFIRYDTTIIFILVVKCQFCPRWYSFGGEERKVIYLGIGMIVGCREKPTVWITRMVHESRGSAMIHTITDMRRRIVRV